MKDVIYFQYVFFAFRQKRNFSYTERSTDAKDRFAVPVPAPLIPNCTDAVHSIRSDVFNVGVPATPVFVPIASNVTTVLSVSFAQKKYTTRLIISRKYIFVYVSATFCLSNKCLKSETEISRSKIPVQGQAVNSLSLAVCTIPAKRFCQSFVVTPYVVARFVVNVICLFVVSTESIVYLFFTLSKLSRI